MQIDSLLKYANPTKPFVNAVKNLYSHKLSKSLTSLDGKICYTNTVGKRYYPGITRTIKKKYFADFKYPTRRTRVKASSSISTGTRVHRQIHHIYSCLKKKTCDCKTKTNLKRLHACTKAVQEFLLDMEIVPDSTEYPIVSPTLKLATSLDMIGTRWPNTQNARSVIISLKTGYSAGYDANSSGQKLSKPLETYESTSQHHNQLQAIVEYEILANDYGIEFDDYYIVYLKQTKDAAYNVEVLKSSTLFRIEKERIYKGLG